MYGENSSVTFRIRTFNLDEFWGKNKNICLNLTNTFWKFKKSLPYSLQYFIHIFRKHNGTHPTKIHFGGNYRAGWVLAVRRMIRIFLDFISTQRNVRHRRIFIDGVRTHKQHARIPSFGTLKCGYQSYLWKFHTVFSDHQNLKISHMNQIFFLREFWRQTTF